MKRILSSLALLAVLSLSLTGCQPGVTTSSEAPPTSSESTDSPSPLSSGDSTDSSSVSSSLPEDGPTTQAAPPSSTLEKTERPTLESLVGTYAPSQDIGFTLSLNLGADSRYQLTVQLLMLSGDVTGSYSLSGSALTLVAEKVNLPVYTGENVGSLTITVQEDGSLYYQPDELGKQMGIDLEEVTLIKQ